MRSDEQRVGERDGRRPPPRRRASRRGGASERGGGRTAGRDVEDGVLAEHAALDDRGERGGDDDAGEDRLIEVADDLFDGERHGGDRRVERGGDAGRGADRKKAPAALRRDRRKRPRKLAMPAQICTVGPSRPSEPPEPI